MNTNLYYLIVEILQSTAENPSQKLDPSGFMFKDFNEYYFRYPVFFELPYQDMDQLFISNLKNYVFMQTEFLNQNKLGEYNRDLTGIDIFVLEDNIVKIIRTRIKEFRRMFKELYPSLNSAIEAGFHQMKPQPDLLSV